MGGRIPALPFLLFNFLKVKIMQEFKIVRVLKQPFYLLVAVGSAILMSILYVYTQVLGNVHNVDVWLAVIPWYNAVLTFLFTVLFGITFSFQVYNWRQPKTCSIEQKVKGAGSTSIGTIGLFLVAQCPACASLGALFLPLSAVIFLAEYSWLINLAGIGLLLFTVYHLGGFKK